jgi:hypothetical protein
MLCTGLHLVMSYPPTPPLFTPPRRFAKLCREAGLVDGKKLSLTSVDLIFTKAKAKVGAEHAGYQWSRFAVPSSGQSAHMPSYAATHAAP